VARSGLNCTLSYTKDGQRRVYRVRAKQVTFGFEMVAEESQARASRAFYPHRTAPTQFAVVVDLIGQAERRSLSRYLMGFSEHALDLDLKQKTTPQMLVEVPSRNFRRAGVPTSGAEFGKVLGEMVYSPAITFECSREHIDWNEDFDISIVQGDLAAVRSEETQYFYPTGVQLNGNQAPAIQAALNGSAPAAVASQGVRVGNEIGEPGV
jgi:hypothetical protein